MVTSEMLRNMRAGPLYAAANVQAGTARAWVSNNGLHFGSRESSAHPRYSVGDCARLILMRELTKTLGLAADYAAAIVNDAADNIQSMADQIVASIDDPAVTVDLNRRILVCTRARAAQVSCKVITLAEYINYREVGGMGFGAEIVSDIAVITVEARDRLVGELTD